MKMSQSIDIHEGINALVHAAGTNSAAKGFHEDWPKVFQGENEVGNRDYQKAITEKLALIHEEISEALGEIRSGHGPRETYYSWKAGDRSGVSPEQEWAPRDDAFPGQDMEPQFKPEGFGVELADAVIRIADLAYLTGIDLGALVLEKAAYNATRPRKHGRQF